MAMTSANMTTPVTMITDGIRFFPNPGWQTTMAIKLLWQSQKFFDNNHYILTTMTITRIILKILVTDGAKPTNHPANYMINDINRPTDIDVMTTFTTSTIIDIYITDNSRESPIISGEVVSHNWGSRISKLGKLSLISCFQEKTSTP